MNKSTLVLLIVVFFKGLVWSTLVPLWQFPDEQAHLAQVNYYVESKELTYSYGKLDTSNEIYLSEKALGTDRDYRGNNRYTFHPDFNIEYTDSLDGLFENQIRDLSKDSRKKMVIRESTFYPPLYYSMAVFPYKFFYADSLFERVFAVRLLSVILLLLTVWLAGKLFRLFFRDDNLAFSATTLVAFHPMLTFVGSGVNSDNLFNLLCTAALYLGLYIVRVGLSARIIFLSLALIYLGVQTKPQGYLFPVILLFPLIFAFVTMEKRKKIAAIFAMVGLLYFAREKIQAFISGSQYLPDIPHHREQAYASVSLPQYIFITIQHTIREVLPWYWGVFKWLGVVLPKTANKVINRALFISGIGLVVYVITVLRKRRMNTNVVSFLFLLYSTLLYFGALTMFDFLFFRYHGFSVGIQGRYFFPMISAHLGLMLLGITAFFPKISWKHKVAKLCAFGMVALNIIAIHTVLSSYYDLNNFQRFFWEASQYKSWFAKFPYLLVYIVLYVLSLISFFYLFMYSGAGQKRLEVNR